MSDADIKRHFRNLPRLVNPPEREDAFRRVSSAIAEDGGIKGPATQRHTPYQLLAFFVPGSQVVGTNRAIELLVPQTCRVIRYDAYLKVAASPGSFQARFTRNNASIRTMSFTAGATAAFAGGPGILNAGDIIRVDVMQIGGVANPGSDLTMLITVQPDITA